jgi:predicted transcriptional regulator
LGTALDTIRAYAIISTYHRGDKAQYIEIMAGRKTIAITERQYLVLRLLWDNGPMTVRELMEKLPRGQLLPYTTVLGMLQHMERSGLVEHEKEGITHRYRPLQSRTETTGNLLRDFVGRFFGGSAQAMIQGLVDAEAMSAADLRAIERRLAATERKATQPSSQERARRSKP